MRPSLGIRRERHDGRDVSGASRAAHAGLRYISWRVTLRLASSHRVLFRLSTLRPTHTVLYITLLEARMITLTTTKYKLVNEPYYAMHACQEPLDSHYSLQHE